MDGHTLNMQENSWIFFGIDTATCSSWKFKTSSCAFWDTLINTLLSIVGQFYLDLVLFCLLPAAGPPCSPQLTQHANTQTLLGSEDNVECIQSKYGYNSGSLHLTTEWCYTIVLEWYVLEINAHLFTIWYN